MADPHLYPRDFGTELWKRLQYIWNQRLTRLLDDLAQPKGEVETAHLRGRIEELKFNLAQEAYYVRSLDQVGEIEPGDISAF